eukprot:TRINITY_DN4393_c0_g2_i1.p1 TRINITY_DN4393_c0_g2~~TRINITY_DN4393_c0_g2_i1.p1  ORF type:complete len:347 (-),score=24.00 TRINITY_DN4393_c0_g2_i1:544-1584(-)
MDAYNISSACLGALYWLDSPPEGFVADPPAGKNACHEASEQVFTVYPSTSALYTDLELSSRRSSTAVTVAWLTWPLVPLMIVALYLCFCYFGKRYMEDRKPFNVKASWRYWNLGLSLFSLCGALRTVPHMAMILLRDGFHTATCSSPELGWGTGVCGLWVMLFVASKVPELGDTVFLVLGKKKVLFLHWYHHVTVLLFCWHAFASRASTGLWFTVMNYTVHALMYFYYFAMSMSSSSKAVRKILGKVAPILTTMQLCQMFVGVGVMVYVYRMKSSGIVCHTDWTNMMYGLGMYTSYAILFAWFFVERYFPALVGNPSAPLKADSPLKGKEMDMNGNYINGKPVKAE